MAKKKKVTKKKVTGQPKLRKSQFITVLSEKLEVPKTKVKEIMTTLFELSVSEVDRVGEITLPDFGKIVKKDRAARQGRNPRTGETIQIPAKTTLKFRIAKALKVRVLGDQTRKPRATKKKKVTRKK